MFYDCVVCVGGPCNEVHGMLLVIDTKMQRGRCVYIYIFVYVSVTFELLRAQCKSCLHLSGCM